MANPVIINPTLTLAGQAAAFNASNDGLELKITHVSFGTAHYDPTGNEIALVAPVGNKVAVAGASRPTPYQIRMVSSWREDVGQVAIGEIAFWAGETLVFVWSKADGTLASYKTDGVSYVLFNDLAFSSVPANSISFVIDPNESVALAALAAHEGAYNAHPQYILRAKFPDYQGHLWGDVSGTPNAIALTLPAIVELTTYIKGNRFSFLATSANTAATTININGVGAVAVLKTGGVPLTAGSIVAGGVYDVYYDGKNFQLTAGAGFASSEATDAEVTELTATESTSWLSVRRLINALSKFAALKGATFTGAVKGLTANLFDNGASFATTEFVKKAAGAYREVRTVTAATVLKTDAAGSLINAAGTFTLTLPSGATFPTGECINFRNSGTGVVTVARSLTDQIIAGNNSLTTIAVGPGASLELVSNATGQWVASGTATLAYSSGMATQDQVNAGTDTAAIVTPKTLRYGFRIILGRAGYVVFPTWLGGFILQWNVAVTLPGSVVNTTYFALPYPNDLCVVVVTGNNNTMMDFFVRISDAEGGRSGALFSDRFKTYNNGQTGSAGMSYFSIGY